MPIQDFRGLKWGPRPNWAPGGFLSKEKEIDVLLDFAKPLKAQLDTINKRLDELGYEEEE